MKENNNGLFKLSDNLQIDKSISEDDRNLIEIKIWKLLSDRIERYTMGDSTSVPIEIAEELLKSICFSLELELNELESKNKIIIEEDLSNLLKDSWSKIESMMKEGKELLEAVIKSSPDIENISYNDTLNEIGEFFKRYDYRFFAHKIDCSIDYQLSNPISESLQGIEYINEYLKALLIENEFCSCFRKENIINILNSYCPDYKGLLINIFEPIVINTIGLDILGEDILRLDISEFQREMLLNTFKNMSKSEVLEVLMNSTRNICNTLRIINREKIDYINKTVLNIYPRIEVALLVGNIDNIFLSFKYKEHLKEVDFIDNDTMDNEKLRDLIEEIKECRFISDKIAMVKEEVKSVRDLVEVLNECFWDDEAFELFKTFSKEELYLIKYYLDNNDKSYISNSKWELNFLKYLKGYEIP